jgi:hypothetical protein
VLLESREIILRGGVKARIPKSAITGFAVHGEDLLVDTAEGRLIATIGAREAGKWAEALAKPAPSLASKLGIGGQSPAYLFGETDDEALLDALAGHHGVDDPAEAALVVAMIDGPASLDAAAELAGDRFLWCVYPKGKAALFGDMEVRRHLRDAGWIDSKTSAISDKLTATRYRRR